jgi:hypothetical protein
MCTNRGDKIDLGEVDEFGDSFTKPVTPEELKDLLSRNPVLSWRSALNEMVIFCPDVTLPILYIAKLYGATLTDVKDNAGITHHFVEDNSTTTEEKMDSEPPVARAITKIDLLEMLKPYISDATYRTFHC